MLTLEQQKMVKENHNLIYAFLNKYKLSIDYYGSAALGLCKAAMNYDSSFGTAFSTYAFVAMYRQYIADRKNEVKYEYSISLDELYTDSDGRSVKIDIPDEIAHLNLEASGRLMWIIESLPLFDLKIVLYKLKGRTLRYIANILGCSRQGVLNHLSIIQTAIRDNKKYRHWEVEDTQERKDILKEIYSLLH